MKCKAFDTSCLCKEQTHNLEHHACIQEVIMKMKVIVVFMESTFIELEHEKYNRRSINCVSREEIEYYVWFIIAVSTYHAYKLRRRIVMYCSFLSLIFAIIFQPPSKATVKNYTNWWIGIGFYSPQPPPPPQWERDGQRIKFVFIEIECKYLSMYLSHNLNVELVVQQNVNIFII